MPGLKARSVSSSRSRLPQDGSGSDTPSPSNARLASLSMNSGMDVQNWASSTGFRLAPVGAGAGGSRRTRRRAPAAGNPSCACRARPRESRAPVRPSRAHPAARRSRSRKRQRRNIEGQQGAGSDQPEDPGQGKHQIDGAGGDAVETASAVAGDLRPCYPRDMCQIIQAVKTYEEQPLGVCRADLERAAELFFGTMEAGHSN